MEYGDGRWFSVPKSAELISQRSFLLVWDWESEMRYSELEPYVVMEPQLNSSSLESLSTENSKSHITNPILPHLVPNPRLQDRVSHQKISDYLNEKDIDPSALSREGEAGGSSLELCRLSEAARIMEEAEDCPSLAKIVERFTESFFTVGICSFADNRVFQIQLSYDTTSPYSAITSVVVSFILSTKIYAAGRRVIEYG